MLVRFRKLKPSARPVECPDDPYRLVSAADCRLMAFESVSEATRLWIKGREFTVGRLLGDAYKNEAHKYAGGALAIFRLAPQDYHRFHSPVDGKIGKMSYIAGEYYTVNVSSYFVQSLVFSSLSHFICISLKLFAQPWMYTERTRGKSCPLTALSLVASWLSALVL